MDDSLRVEHRYVVTTHASTAVTHCTLVHGKDDVLVLVKGLRLEVFGSTVRSQSTGALEFWYEKTLYGRVASLKAFRPEDESDSCLALLTEQRQLCVLRAHRSGLQTVSCGDLGEYPGGHKTVESDELSCHVEGSRRRVAACHIFNGVLKCVPIAESGAARCIDAFASRLSEIRVLDMVFVHITASEGENADADQAMLAVLSDDGCGNRHVSSYCVSVRSRKVREGSWAVRDVDPTSRTLLAPPVGMGGGLVILGEREIGLLDTTTQGFSRTATAWSAKICAVCDLDATKGRWLVGDNTGRLYSVMVAQQQRQQHQGRKPRIQALQHQGRKPRIQALGPISDSAASCLSYLGDGKLFFGSSLADSKLVELGAQGAVSESVVIANPGPIVDMCVVEPTDATAGGQGAVVACCGTGKNGSLRIVRQGVDMSPLVNRPPPDKVFGCPRGLWALRDSVLVVTYSCAETRAYTLSTSPPFPPCAAPDGFITKERTLLCAVVGDGVVVQVTRATVSAFALDAFSSSSGSSTRHWQPPSRPTLADATEDRLVVVCADASMWLLVPDTLEVISKLMDNAEATCLSALGGHGSRPMMIAWSEWDTPHQVKLLADTQQGQLQRQQIASLRDDDAAKSVVLAALADNPHLVVGSVGCVTLYALGVEDSAPPVARTSVSLGNSPVQVWRWHDAVLCAGDRAAIIASSRGKLDCSAVHLSLGDDAEPNKFWTACCCAPLVVPHSLDLGRAIKRPRLGGTTESKLSIVVAAGGRISLCAVSRAREVRTAGVALGDQPRCVCHARQAKLFGVGTAADLSHATKGGTIRFIEDADPYEHVAIFDLDDFEEAISCCAARLQGGLTLNNKDEETATATDPRAGSGGVEAFLASLVSSGGESRKDVSANHLRNEECEALVIVGTSIQSPGEFEPSAGRVLVFAVSPHGDRAMLRATIEAHGAVYDLCDFTVPSSSSPLRIAACVNHAVVVYELSSGGMKQTACFEGFVVAFKEAVAAPNLIVVGDLMRSVSILRFKPEDNKLSEAARDYRANWTSAVAAIDGHRIVCAEASCNLLALRRRPAGDDDRCLETDAEMHLGQHVTCFAEGSLAVTSNVDSGDWRRPLLFGCTSGMIGCVLPIESRLVEIFSRLTYVLLNYVDNPGRLEYGDWRKFKNEARPAEGTFSGFVDGDLVEQFLDLPRPTQLKVVERFNEGRDPMQVEDLAHHLARLRQRH